MLRQGGLKLHILPCLRMHKADEAGVEQLAGAIERILLYAVDHIPHYGVANACHVHPDLMGASRLQPAPEEGIALILLLHLIMGQGRF